MPKKVLIIEDSEPVGDALQLLIGFEGYDVAVARTAAEGHEKAVSEQPDLILMDIALPDYDGAELTRRLRRLDETARIPILCVSSYTGGRVDEIREAGCDEVFSKTKFMIDFRDTIRKYIG